MEIEVDMNGIEAIIGTGDCRHYVVREIREKYSCNDCNLYIPTEDMESNYTPLNCEGSTLYIRESFT